MFKKFSYLTNLWILILSLARNNAKKEDFKMPFHSKDSQFKVAQRKMTKIISRIFKDKGLPDEDKILERLGKKYSRKKIQLKCVILCLLK